MSSKKDKRSTRIDLTEVNVNLPSFPEPSSSLEKPQSKSTSGRNISASTGHLGKRKASLSPSLQDGRKSLRGEPRDLALVDTSKFGKNSMQSPIVRDESPWDTFRKVYECDLAGTVAVVVRRTAPTRIHAIRQFASQDAVEMLEILHFVHHENIIHGIQYFRTEGAFYAEVEHFPLTLENIVACRMYPDERQLAIILTQVTIPTAMTLEANADYQQILNGLSYLIERHFRHGSLNCSSIIMNLNGKIQIACLEECQRRISDDWQKEDVLAVAKITMNLMQKYSKDDGAIGVDNLDRWPFNSLAVSFLSTTSSADSIEELRQHHLIRGICRSEGELIGLAWFALISARTFYSFDP
ncbi:hypothetical protein AJ79_09705 [Helicocarpus griseus UAMH5409]|uniref:Protein kinase domain-containing protein n=1 Tax=Helicocarpus griseus UAMH5409 TaxID=1447875 RepID=A0A2B7W9F2_9EURO|nr:hypothetical protein AJ79_09705 [Helicocarpus griseus UAMH5409]